MKKVSVIVIFALMACLPAMSAQVGRPNEPAKKPTKKPAPKPPTKPTSRVDRGSAALKELFNSFVQIPAGEFPMGSENGGDDDEKPVHRVRISRAFEIGKYEVTQAQWQAVMGGNPSHFKNCGGNCPVENVSWNDAQQFIRKLNALNDGYTYRLPTEAEWEYACRAGSTGDYAGNLDAMAWYDKNSGNTTHPVGQKQPNAWRLYDMHGNVWEWCEDWYGGNYYAQSPSVDPRGPSARSVRLIRGGCWNSFARFCRSAYRDGYAPTIRRGFLGFRLVRTLR